MVPIGGTFTLTPLVFPEGLEPPTPWFEARYSIQLSYGRNPTQQMVPSKPAFIKPKIHGKLKIVNCQA